MSKFKKKKDGGLPAISTASLPDIVFMLLFFFMVATVMRENSLKIQNALPVANQVEKLDKKNPWKKNRPIASDLFSKKNAILIALLLFITIFKR